MRKTAIFELTFQSNSPDWSRLKKRIEADDFHAACTNAMTWAERNNARVVDISSNNANPDVPSLAQIASDFEARAVIAENVADPEQNPQTPKGMRRELKAEAVTWRVAAGILRGIAVNDKEAVRQILGTGHQSDSPQ